MHDDGSPNLPDNCSWHHFWLGYKDWLAEKSASAEDVPAEKRSPVGLYLATLAFLVFGGALLLVNLAPFIAGGMSKMGPTAVLWSCMLAAVPLVVWALVVWPARRIIRLWRFSQQMCKRGRELEAGLRMPATC